MIVPTKKGLTSLQSLRTMSYFFWLIMICSILGYSLFVGDTYLKIRSDLAGVKSQLDIIVARLPS